MKIIFLASALRDLQWFSRYYSKVFPEGRSNAQRQYKSFLSLLKSNPEMGFPHKEEKQVREFSIPRTPFGVIYRIKSERIEIVRVYDQRSEFSNENT